MADGEERPGSGEDASRYWDSVARSKTFTHELDLERFEELVPLDVRVVDVGCGYGRMLGALLERGYSDLVGVDSSPAMLARGRRNHPGLDLRCSRASALPLADGSAGAVLLMAVLTCVPTDDAQRALVSEALRILGPGGTLWEAVEEVATPRMAPTNRLAALSEPTNGATMRGSRRLARRSMGTTREAATSSTASWVTDVWCQRDERHARRYVDDRPEGAPLGVFRHPEGVVFRHHERSWIDELFLGTGRIQLEDVRFQSMNGNTVDGFRLVVRKI